MNVNDDNRYHRSSVFGKLSKSSIREIESSAFSSCRQRVRTRAERTAIVIALILWMIYSTTKGMCRFNEQILRQCALPRLYALAYRTDVCIGPFGESIKFVRKARHAFK